MLSEEHNNFIGIIGLNVEIGIRGVPVIKKIYDFISKQDAFIRIAIYVGAGFIILFAGYLVGGLIGRLT
ncbi:hypothetical protein GJU40_17120 [Bacillus lacus]|uniref:Uncharacterized protein n=1 Tax=Metabacillus lacus TaxID=1983721 RepID=A0A7X2LZW5_9BACI|nr:hypothetical protein [Metabacillus lacus]MRX73866.1 hypothetical protein [Metabacillus lacus]